MAGVYEGTYTAGIAEVAVRIATRAAVAYLDAHGLKADDEALANSLKAMCKIRLPAALHDANEAIQCGMASVAEHTFRASMALAGIEAAKEAGYPAAWPTAHGPA